MNKAVAITARILTSIISFRLGDNFTRTRESQIFFISYIQSNDTDFYITSKYNYLFHKRAFLY